MIRRADEKLHAGRITSRTRRAIDRLRRALSAVRSGLGTGTEKSGELHAGRRRLDAGIVCSADREI